MKKIIDIVKSKAIIIGLFLVMVVMAVMMIFFRPSGQVTIPGEVIEIDEQSEIYKLPGESAVDTIVSVDRIKNNDKSLSNQYPFTSSDVITSLADIGNLFQKPVESATNDWLAVSLAAEKNSLTSQLNYVDEAGIQSAGSDISLKMTWDFMNEEPTVYTAGNYALYEYEDLDIQYEIQSNIFKESIIFNARPENNILVAKLDYPDNYILEMQSDGSILVSAREIAEGDMDGSTAYNNYPVWEILPATLSDRKGNTVTVPANFDAATRQVSYQLDELFLKDASYPIVLDPSVTRPSARYTSRLVWNDDNNTAILFGGGVSLSGEPNMAANNETWLYEPNIAVPVYRADHDYRITICISGYKKLNFAINDNTPGGNSGSLSIDTCVDNSCINNGLAETVVVPFTSGTAGVDTANTYGANGDECINLRIQGSGTSNNGGNNVDAFYDDISGIPTHLLGNQYTLLIDGKSPEDWIPGSQGIWTKKMPASAPAKRSGFDMIWDNANSQVILYGGAGEATNVVYNDTWIYTPPASHHDQGTWTNQNPASNPGKLYGQQMAWDGTSLILHGGYEYDLSQVVNKTYSYNPTANTWTQTATNGPSVRYAAMEYSPGNSSVYVFGGDDGTNYLDGLWKYTAGSWSEMTDTGAPTARSHTDMVWDSQNSQFILFGGKDALNYYNETYVLNVSTNTWSNKTPTDPPDRRSDTAMCWDNNQNKVMYFGGRNTATIYGDIWWYDPDNTAEGVFSGGNLYTPYAPVLDNAECDYFEINDFISNGNTDETVYAIKVVTGATTKYADNYGKLWDEPTFVSKTEWSLPLRIVGLANNTSYDVSLIAKDINTGKLADESSVGNISTLASCGYTPTYDSGCDLYRSGTIGTQTWSDPGHTTYGPTLVVCIDGNLTIPQGETLSIFPGTVVKVTGDYSINVYGYLNVGGTADEPVYMVSIWDDDTPDGDTAGDGYCPGCFVGTGWGSVGAYEQQGGIRFVASATDTATGDFEHVIIRNSYGVNIREHNLYGQPEPVFKYVTFYNNNNWAVYADRADPAVNNMTIRDTAGPALMLYRNDSGTNFRLNGVHNVYNNYYNGILLYNYGGASQFDGTRIWYNDLPYYFGPQGQVPYMTIATGGNVIVEPGTILKFGLQTGGYANVARLSIFGTITADGTPEYPIYFTSGRDDTVGQEMHPEWFDNGVCRNHYPCDTKNDGTNTSPTAGDWGYGSDYYAKGGIRFEAGSGTPATGILDNVIVKYADGGIRVAYHNTQSQTEPTISNVTVVNSSTRAFSIYQANPTLTNMSIYNNEGAAIFMQGNDYGTNIEYAGVQDVHDNGVNGVQLNNYSGTNIDSSRSWHNDLPYYVGRESMVPYLAVNNNITLTIEPGTIVKFPVWSAYNKQGHIDVNGTLNATGTAAKPIYFTDGYDDTVGQETHPEWFSGGNCIANTPCDTNADGSATSPAAGNWGYDNSGGLRFTAGPTYPATGNLDYVYILYSTTGINVQNHNQYSQTEPTISHSTIENCSLNGMYVYFANLVLDNMTFKNNAQTAVYINRNDYGSNVELTGTHEVYNNGINGIFLENYGLTHIDTSRHWSSGIPYYLGTDSGWDYFIIDGGVTLTVDPGAVIKFHTSGSQKDERIINYGTLNSVGTAAAPIYYTSSFDDTAGQEAHPEWFESGVCKPNYACDTNNNGTANSPAKEDWGALQYETGSTGQVKYSNFRYGAGGTGDFDYLLAFNNASGTIELANNKFNFTNRGLLATNTNLNIHHNEFISSSDYGVVFYNPPAGTIFEYNTISGFDVGVYASGIASGLTLANNNIDAVTYYVQNGSTPFQAGSCGDVVSGTSIDACVNNWGAYPVEYYPPGKLYKNPGNIFFTDIGVEVTSPNGGEDWETYSTHNITWTTNDGTATVALADLYYSTDNGSSWNLIEADLTHAGTPTIAGSYSWMVPDVVPTTQALIRVDVKDSLGNVLGSDISDGPFSISEFTGIIPVIVSSKTFNVSASVPNLLSFTVNGVASGTVNGAALTTTTTATQIDFGTFTGADNRIAAQDLIVTTNATDGYIVTLQFSGTLSTGTDTISDFTGTNTAPAAWSSPPGSGTEGYFGYTTEDTTLHIGTADRFDSNLWAGLTTTPQEIMYHNDVTDGSGAGVGNTRIGYQIDLTGNQAAGIYTTNLMYICTPTY